MARNLDDFVSAGVFPHKLLNAIHEVRRQTLESKERHVIAPYHIQFSPTNRCNAKCAWCSCRNVDRKLEMSIDEIREMIFHFAGLGAAAITLTGGGEPTLHPHFDQILETCVKRNLRVGLVTNGLTWTAAARLGKREADATALTRKCVTWVRLSIVDTESGNYDAGRLARLAELLPGVDIGVSFTVTPRVSILTAASIARIAEQLPHVTHIRYVEEILQGAPAALDLVEETCTPHTTKGIYQRRGAYTAGAARCLMSKLKPMIDPRGLVFPCCGVQYADGGERQSLDMGDGYRMCRWNEYSLDTPPFDGSGCVKCYYGQYQALLAQFEAPVPRHAAFV
jgi:pyruvate-formate lyase-activating enzyme